MDTTLQSRFLATLDIELGEMHALDNTPAGSRRFDIFKGGTFKGPKIAATLLGGGTDAILRRNDDAMQQDVRFAMKTDDGAVIFCTYRGVRHAPEEVMARIARNEPVQQHEYYLRNVPFFETGDPRYAWMNRIVAVGMGRRAPGRVAYDIFEVL
jgi:hypothetical protein